MQKFKSRYDSLGELSKSVNNNNMKMGFHQLDEAIMGRSAFLQKEQVYALLILL